MWYFDSSAILGAMLEQKNSDAIKSLLSESYERSYSLFLENYHLYELEEIIQLKKGESFLSRDELKKKWDSRYWKSITQI